MAKHVPLISSACEGPLGVVHLPRLWQKLLLEATGSLHDEYPSIGAGFDSMVLDGLGLDHDETRRYVRENKPTYAQFEQWVRDNADADALSRESINELNSAIRGYEHGDDTRGDILQGAGIRDDGSIRTAVALNQLEDWQEFHKSVTR